jgi:hypothetical protein
MAINDAGKDMEPAGIDYFPGSDILTRGQKRSYFAIMYGNIRQFFTLAGNERAVFYKQIKSHE